MPRTQVCASLLAGTHMKSRCPLSTASLPEQDRWQRQPAGWISLRALGVPAALTGPPGVLPGAGAAPSAPCSLVKPLPEYEPLALWRSSEMPSQGFLCAGPVAGSRALGERFEKAAPSIRELLGARTGGNLPANSPPLVGKAPAPGPSSGSLAACSTGLCPDWLPTAVSSQTAPPPAEDPREAQGLVPAPWC